MSDPDRWRRAKPILDQALLLIGRERNEYIDKACDQDPELHTYLQELIALEEKELVVFDDPVLTFFEKAFYDETLHPGDMLDKYLIYSLLGQGGMGRVYAAELREAHFHKSVAIKVLDRIGDRAEMLRRFRQECHILATLKHPHITRILDGGFTASGQPYMVMERVEGADLMTYLKTRPLELAQLLQLFEKICDAVQFAHRNLIVHRDLKPGNVLVTSEGEPTLLDFGISKLLDREYEPEEQTRPEARLMTPEYASPEQWAGEAVTTASDVYALGVLLFQAVTGKRPYELNHQQEGVVNQFALETPLASSLLVKRRSSHGAGPGMYPRHLVRGDLDAILSKALAIQPNDRYGSPANLVDDLRRFRQGHPVTANRAKPFYVAHKFIQRHRLAVSLASVFSLSLMVLTFALLWQRKATIEALATAQQEATRSQELNKVVLDLFRKPNPYQRTGANLTVKELIDDTLSEMNEDTLAQVDIKTELLLTFGQALIGMGLIDEAADRLALAELLAKNHLPTDHPRIAKILAARGGNALYLSNISEGRQALEEALNRQNNTLPYIHPDRIRTLQNFGKWALYSREYEAGKTYIEQAIDLHQHFPHRPDLEPDLSHEIFGCILVWMNDPEQALFHLQESMRIRVERWGFNHPTMSETLNSFAFYYSKNGDLELAEILLDESLLILEPIFHPCNPELVYTLSQTALLLFSLDRLEESESLYRQIIVCGENDTGSCFPSYIFTWNSLGSIMLNQGRLAESKVAFSRYNHLAREGFGETSTTYVDSLLKLAYVMAHSDQLQQAQPYFLDALSRLKMLGLGESKESGICLAFLAKFEAERGRLQSACDTMEQALLLLSKHNSDPEVMSFHTKRNAWLKQLQTSPP